MMKLQLTLPATVLDLCQQLSNQDVMQFSASSPSDGQLNTMLQRLDHHIIISIDGCREDVLQDINDGLCCIVQGITSHVLLTPASSSSSAGIPADGSEAVSGEKGLLYSNESFGSVDDVREMQMASVAPDEGEQMMDAPSASMDMTRAVMVENVGMEMAPGTHVVAEEGAMQMAMQADAQMLNAESVMVAENGEMSMMIHEVDAQQNTLKHETSAVAECIRIPTVSEADAEVAKMVMGCDAHCNQVDTGAEAEAVILEIGTNEVDQCDNTQKSGTMDESLLEMPREVDAQLSSDVVAAEAGVEMILSQVSSEEISGTSVDNLEELSLPFAVKSDQQQVIYIDNGSHTDLTMQTIVLDNLNRAASWKSILQPLPTQPENTSTTTAAAVAAVAPPPDKDSAELARAKDRKSRRNADGQLFGCPICSNGYQVLSSLHKHLRVTHHSHPQYDMAMKQIASVRWQRLRRKSSMMLPCALCGFNCHGHQLFRHIQEEHSDLPDLDAQLAAARKLYNYKARRFYPRSAPKRHLCSHGCGKSFLKGYLRQHEMKCCGPKPAEDSDQSRLCTYCDKRFKSRNRFLDHMRRVHRMKADKSFIMGHTCPICNRNFAIRAKLKYHMRVVHTEERKHACGVCGRTYKDAYAVRYHHRIVHLGEHRYNCSKCGRHFDKVTRLQTHICTADVDGVGVKVDPIGNATEGVICTLCGDIFRHKTDLNDHKRIVHRIAVPKPMMKYMCEECGAWFSTRGELKTHMYLHSDDRQHLCEVCGLRFKNKYTMKQHHKTQHLNIYRFSCEECKRVFDKLIHLRRHSCQPRRQHSFRYKTADTQVMVKWQRGTPFSELSKQQQRGQEDDDDSAEENQVLMESDADEVKKEGEEVHVLPGSGGGSAERKARPGTQVCEQVLVTYKHVAGSSDTPDEKGDGHILVRFQPVEGAPATSENGQQDATSVGNKKEQTVVKNEPVDTPQQRDSANAPVRKEKITKVQTPTVTTPRTSYRLKLKKAARMAKQELSDS